MLTSSPGGGGGSLIFSYIRRFGSFFWGSNFDFQIFGGVFRKMNIFWGTKILWIFFGVKTDFYAISVVYRF